MQNSCVGPNGENWRSGPSWMPSLAALCTPPSQVGLFQVTCVPGGHCLPLPWPAPTLRPSGASTSIQYLPPWPPCLPEFMWSLSYSPWQPLPTKPPTPLHYRVVAEAEPRPQAPQRPPPPSASGGLDWRGGGGGHSQGPPCFLCLQESSCRLWAALTFLTKYRGNPSSAGVWVVSPHFPKAPSLLAD